MATRRRSLNPTKVKADRKALEAEPSDNAPPRRLLPGRRLSAVLLNLLSAVLLFVSFAPFGHWYLAYVALVPWTLALIGGTSRRWSLASCFLGAVVFWAAGVYWLTWVTLPGFFGSIVLLASYRLLAGAVLRPALLRNMPAWLMLPVVWVAMEYLRAHALTGFPWFMLAHAQFRQIHLIQIADVTGQYGVSFFVAMVNGVLVDLLVSPVLGRTPQRAKPVRRLVVGAAVASVSLAGLLGYGSWRLSQKTTEPGPVVGIVQQDFPISLYKPKASPEKILSSHVSLTEDSMLGADCDLVVWPETVLPPGLNPQVLQQDLNDMAGDDLWSLGTLVLPRSWLEGGDEDIRFALDTLLHSGGIVPVKGGRDYKIIPARAHLETITKLVDKLKCPLLAGGSTIHRNTVPIGELDQWEPRNSAIWFEPGKGVTAMHSKRHLVPFSEYVPFKRSWYWLHRQLRKFVPPQMQQLAPGPRIVRFSLPRRDSSAQPWRLASPICFEGTFARVCREMVMKDGVKAVDVLVNMSNDGWFVFQWGDSPPRRSAEHCQHLVQYCFRAIENRVPLVRAVNTGISASIDSNGVLRRVLRLGDSPSLPINRGQTLMPGAMVLGGDEKSTAHTPSISGPQVLVDSRVSPYSMVGDVFAMLVSLAALFVAAWVSFRKSGQRAEVQEK